MDNRMELRSAIDKRVTCCQSVRRVLRREFYCRSFGFNFEQPGVFYSSQWEFPRGFFLAYRLTLAAYSLTVLVLSLIYFNPNESKYPWPAYLTYWSYTVLTLHLVWAAIISLGFSGRQDRCCERDRLHQWTNDWENDENLPLPLRAAADGGVYVTCNSPTLTGQPPRLPWYLQLDWFLFTIASVNALLVTMIYHGPYMASFRFAPAASDIDHHIMNTVMVIMEFLIAAIPVRLLHFIYPLLFNVAYVCFTAIYWAVDHNNALYPGVLDWNRPETSAFVVVISGLVVIPGIVVIYFLVYQIRLFAYRRLYDVSLVV